MSVCEPTYRFLLKGLFGKLSPQSRGHRERKERCLKKELFDTDSLREYTPIISHPSTMHGTYGAGPS
ncbi:MAG: hypothetical protein JJE19_08570 [Methanosarcinales archaeon]|nr:hypothetical protein [Methanosarcinales archaeon]